MLMWINNYLSDRFYFSSATHFDNNALANIKCSGQEPGKPSLPMRPVCVFVSGHGPVVAWKFLNSFIVSALFCVMPLGRLLTKLSLLISFNCHVVRKMKIPSQ